MTVRELINKLCILVESNEDIKNFIVLHEINEHLTMPVKGIEILWPSETSIVLKD